MVKIWPTELWLPIRLSTWHTFHSTWSGSSASRSPSLPRRRPSIQRIWFNHRTSLSHLSCWKFWRWPMQWSRFLFLFCPRSLKWRLFQFRSEQGFINKCRFVVVKSILLGLMRVIDARFYIMVIARLWVSGTRSPNQWWSSLFIFWSFWLQRKIVPWTVMMLGKVMRSKKSFINFCSIADFAISTARSTTCRWWGTSSSYYKCVCHLPCVVSGKWKNI